MVRRLDLGRRYHCRELRTTEKRTGLFWRDIDTMEAKLFDYENFFHLKDGMPLYLQLENNLIVSMIDTVVSGPGRTHYLRDPPATTYFTGITANTLVIGHRSWSPLDSIQRVWFSIPYSKSLLMSSAKLKAVRAKRFPSKIASEPLFEIEAEGLKVRCWYSLQGSWEFGTSDWEPLFDIEFKHPRNLHTYLEPVHTVLQFFSVATGFHLTPTKIAISPLTLEEQAAAIEEGRDEEFSVEYVWTEGVVEERDLHMRNSFVHALDRTNLSSLKACLKAWLVRDADWRKATMLMMGSLNLVREASGHRLLMACRWLEAIPGTRALPALSNAELSLITAEATKTARRLGHTQLDRRIKGLLKTIKLESNQARFERLVTSVRKPFGSGAFGNVPEDDVVPALMRAIVFRGQEAHSFVAECADDIMPLMAATTAMEALCYLLTIKDLPMDQASRKRAVHSRIVRAYQYAQMAVAGAAT